MKTAGIICEYDPFHKGHEYLISELRRAGAENVICVMSGNAVQRGEPAILPREYRAEAAVRGGADAVFELPYPWCSASAGDFARVGVTILASLGCDTVAFGSESGDLRIIEDCAARMTATAGEKKTTDTKCRNSVGTAGEFLRRTGADILGPNDLLGANYVCAARTAGLDGLGFYPVKRVGAGHDSGEDGEYPSASGLRAHIIRGQIPQGMTEKMQENLIRAKTEGRCPVTFDNISAAILSFWRTADPAEAGKFAECGGGVAGLLHRAAEKTGNYAAMTAAAATKKYTNARLRRAILFGMTGVMPDDLRETPAYVRLLCANERGRAYLASIRRTKNITVVTKPCRIPSGDAACRQREMGRRLDALLTLACPNPASLTDEERLGAVMISTEEE